MAALVFGKEEEKLYETGVSKGVLYPKSLGGTYPQGVVWNGLTNVTESPEGGEPTPFYADNEVYVNLVSKEKAKGTIEAFYAPEEFKECDGSKEVAPGVYAGQQDRKAFGMSYVTQLGSEADSNLGYVIHLVWDMLAAPSEKSHSTTNEDPELNPLSWSYTATPQACPGAKSTATMTIDSTKVDATCLAALEKVLYGDTDTEARLPLPTEVVSIMTPASTPGTSQE